MPVRNITIREMHATPKPPEAAIWAVCQYLRCREPCLQCPEWEDGSSYGRTQRACRGIAEETIQAVTVALGEGS